MSSGDFRFDDIVRTERYFTATILPAILLHDGFAGLRRFLELVGQRAPRPRGATGVVLTTDIALPPIVAAAVEIVTEFFITRDLKAASKLPTPPSEPANALDPDGPTRLDAPDLVIVVGDQLVVCEGKFFGLCNPVALNQQLRSQRRQIELLFKSRPMLKFYRHIAILPFAFSQGKLECDTTFTWAEMRDLAREILGPSHYLTRRLVAAVAYYELLAGGPAMGAASFGGQVPLEDALDMCRKSPQGIWIGFTGGLQALQATPRPRLLARPWKWRDSTHTGNITASNWIIGQTFVPIIENLLDGAPPPTPGPAPLRYARTRVRLDEALTLCESATSPIYVGFSGGKAAFQSATLAQLEQKWWQWRDPMIHTMNVTQSNWIPGSDFVRSVKALQTH